MAETDESGIDMSRGSFKLADAETQDTAKLAMILDLMAQRPAVQTLKAWALEQLAPAAGETAVDVGSGTGEDVVRFAKLVGAHGRAIGVEPSAGLRAEAVRRATEATVERAAGTNVESVDGDAEATGESVDRAAEATVEFVDGYAGALPFEPESVDALRSERVLQHVADPAGAVQDMARVLRPGGRIALIDTDWSTAIIHPADPAVLKRMVDYFVGDSANPYSGRRLRGLLAGAGLEITGETAATWIEAQEGARQGFVSMMHLTSLEAGIITRAEAEAFAQGIADAADRGAFHLSLTMYAVSARKPAG
ncbi:methyltransferase domain-containing protein [Kribbella sp. NPDC049174]|uniref:methyltransferase domain-containing protein n=1 Tax=Kribbella sp. NPDC049174 TaxID=3364112 RepID=UPI003722EAAB